MATIASESIATYLELGIKHNDRHDSNDFNTVWGSADIMKCVTGMGNPCYEYNEEWYKGEKSGVFKDDAEFKDLQIKIRELSRVANEKVLLRYKVLIGNPYLPRRDVYVYRALSATRFKEKVINCVSDNNMGFVVNLLCCPLTCVIIMGVATIWDCYTMLVWHFVFPLGLLVDLLSCRDVNIFSTRCISLTETQWLNSNLFNDHKELDSKMIEDQIIVELEKFAKDLHGTTNLRRAKAIVKRVLLPCEEDDGQNAGDWNTVTNFIDLYIPSEKLILPVAAAELV